MSLIVAASLAGVTAVLAASFIGNGSDGSRSGTAATGSSHPRTSIAPSAAAAGTASASGNSYLACMVSDTGGISDKSFNASAWQGMQEAAAANPKITAKYLQSTSHVDALLFNEELELRGITKRFAPLVANDGISP